MYEPGTYFETSPGAKLSGIDTGGSHDRFLNRWHSHRLSMNRLFIPALGVSRLHPHRRNIPIKKMRWFFYCVTRGSGPRLRVR